MKRSLVKLSARTYASAQCPRRSSGFVRSTSIAAVLVLGSLAHALTVNTSNPGTITAFQVGATIETFDAGLTGLVITSYTPVAVPAGSQFFSRNINDPSVPSFNSGGASFNNPPSNPGTPVGVFNPEGGIATQVSSQTNVIGPIDLGLNQAFGSGFMEVRFVNPVSKIGFQVTHGSLVVFAKDINNSNLAGLDSSVNGTIGNFIGLSRSAADIGGLTILSTNPNDSFTLDDFTFAGATTTPPTSTVPDAGVALNLALAGAFLWAASRKLKPRDQTSG